MDFMDNNESTLLNTNSKSNDTNENNAIRTPRGDRIIEREMVSYNPSTSGTREEDLPTNSLINNASLTIGEEICYSKDSKLSAGTHIFKILIFYSFSTLIS